MTEPLWSPRLVAVLLHGLGGCPADWSHLSKTLPIPDHVPALVGHAGREPPCEMSFRALADDVMRQVDDAAQLILVGLSMGSAVAATITSLWPERVRAVLHVAPAWVDEPEPENLRRMQKLGSVMNRHGLDRVWDFLRGVSPISGWSEADHDHYRSEFLKAAPGPTSQMLIELPRVLPVLDHTSLRVVPSAVLTWNSDPIHPPRVAHALAHLVGTKASIYDRPRCRADEAAFLRRALDRLLEQPDPRRLYGAETHGGTP